MDRCWWCMWFHRGQCLRNAPRREAASAFGWCGGFAGVSDLLFHVRQRMYKVNLKLLELE